MKKHAIIPVFISHRGCPHDCVFCNQKRITAREGDVTPDDARGIIEQWLTTLGALGPENVEVSFFGGSFTGIPLDEQKAFLAVAKEYKDAGKIGKIHLSTRPDYINDEILDNLEAYGTDVIELGVQSFDDEVLRLSGRGHTAEDVYRSVELIKKSGFTLGLQLMIGLPGDSYESCIYSARETVRLAPQIARLYPTVVIKDTELWAMYERGEYEPLNEEEAVVRTKAMYEIIDGAGIDIIRVGLKSSEIMADQMSFHPAFRQLVEGRIARGRIEEQIEKLIGGAAGKQSSSDAEDGMPETGSQPRLELTVRSNPRCVNNVYGHKGVNRGYFREKYPFIIIKCETDESLKDGEYRLSETKGKRQQHA